MSYASLISFFLFCCGGLQAEQPLAKRPLAPHYDYQLAIASIFCDEAPYLKEWIEYHKLIGVEHFYLYNNQSSDSYLEVLSPYIKNHDVDLIEWPHKSNNVGEFDQIQIAAYHDALNLAKGRVNWLAIIDLDEFLVPVKTSNLAHDLRKFESFGGVCLIWSFFGTSNVQKIPPDKTLIESLVFHSGPAAVGQVQHIWDQGAYKSIVRPTYVKKIPSPHYCTYVKGKHHTMVPYDDCHINHYWTRDENYFNTVKIPRREKWGQSSDSVRSWAVGMNAITQGNPILRFVPQLRERMGLPATVGISRN